jgi:GT2 family glycosyltransferase
VLLTYNRRDEAAVAAARLLDLPDRPTVVAVDNASSDGTAELLRDKFPEITVLELGHNLGAVGRNIGVTALSAPYVAFCDDDTWWDPGSLTRAADLLEAHPALAVITATILVEPGGRDDPVNRELRESPVRGPSWLPGPALGSFLAGASVVRREAFLGCGGFHPKLWLGGEEELLAADLAAAGWELCHVPEMVVHHAPSPARDAHLRRRNGIRNTLWFTWLRRPVGPALRRTWFLARTVPRDRVSLLGALDALRGTPWVLRQRNVLPPWAEERFRALERSQRESSARRYVS